jgi:Type I phosphodiesterase / nucleotide pyrophosphatase
MNRIRIRLLVIVAMVSMALPTVAGGGVVASAAPAHPNRVLIVLFDQMIPEYANQFDMPNFRSLRDAGTNFKKAYLGYMASETVIAHNVITSGQLPKHMGWTDEAYRDAGDLLGKGAGAMHITGDLSLTDFGTLISNEGYPKLADYLHTAYPGKKFIVVGEKSYAVESAVAPNGDIGVRMSGRSSSTLDACGTLLGGRYRRPSGKNVPAYLLGGPLSPPDPACGRYFINSADAPFDYGTRAAFPSSIYPEDGNRFFPGTDASALAGHTGGDVWVADAAIEMMNEEPWSGMFVTLGAIDKAAHMWGAQADAASFTGDCNDPDPVVRGANQTHVRCAAEIADVQLGKLMDSVSELDASDGGETLMVLTADHGATYGAGTNFYGRKAPVGISNANWYYAPNGVWDAGTFTDPVSPCRNSPCITSNIYSQPSPALQPLIDTGNVEFSYQSTAVETWLIDRSLSKMKEGAAAMLKLPGVIASYWHDGDQFRFLGKNTMTGAEASWWRLHGQELVNSMAAPNGPDVIGLLHDKTSYGVYGDHGGAQESVQRVPMVFWSPSNAFANDTGAPFKTIDIMPTILDVMGIPQTGTTDGVARPLD